MGTIYPKVLVATVTYKGKDYVFDEFYNAIKNLTYPNYQFMMVDNTKGNSYLRKLRSKGINAFNVERGSNSYEALTNSYNFVREYFLKYDFDYLMIIESDLIVPKNIIEMLMANFKQVVGAPYYIGGYDGIPKTLCITMTYPKQNGIGYETRIVNPNESNTWLGTGLKKVQGMGIGCVLIQRHIIEKIPFRNNPDFFKHPDTYFYLDLWNAGIPVYLDLNIPPITHKNQNWNLVRKQLKEEIPELIKKQGKKIYTIKE